MKSVLTIIFLLVLNLAQGQQYFQHRFNLNVYPAVRNERFNSGIRTQNNFDANNAYYYVGIGTSYNNTGLASPHNIADRLRFTRMNKSGNAVLSNMGYHFLRDGRILHASGNSIAEIRNTTGNGGYVAVGAVTSNHISGAVAAGGSDILFTRLNAAGGVVGARRIDIGGGGSDIAWYIRKSVIMVGNQPTWLICGESRRASTYTDAFVARVDMNGNIIWANHYNFDPGGGLFNSAHSIAKQLTEDTAGNIYVVGTLQDNAWANGIDGLAFKLNSGGGLLWANNYHLAPDDEFQAVRLTSGGNLIVGGFTNAAGMYNMQITSLTTAAGAILFQNILRAGIGGTFYPSKAYDILETPGPQYFLAGVLTQAGVNKEMLYQVGAGGAGIRWNSYNPMVYNIGFGIDYVRDANCPGIAYFSSMKNLSNPAFSDGHIMKTDLATRTCKYLEPKAPARLPYTLVRYPRQYKVQRTFTASNLSWTGFNYLNWSICYVNCPAGAAVGERTIMDVAETERAVSNSKLAIGPNPVRHNLHIRSHALPAGEYQIELRDMKGGLVLKSTNVFNQGALSTDLDLSSVPAGVYILSVRQGTLVLQQKVVKQ